MPLDGLAVAALARELHLRWAGARVTRIVQPNPTDIVMKLRHRGVEEHLVCSAHPTLPWVGTTSEPEPGTGYPPPFCMLLRKYLESSRLIGVSQPGWERALYLHFDAAHGPSYSGSPTESADVGGRVDLVVELIPRRANIVLIRPSQGIIIDALFRHPGRDDQRLPGQPYAGLPPQEKLDPAAPPEKLEPVLRLVPGSRPLAQHLAAHIAGLSPAGAAALLSRAGLPPSWQGPVLDGEKAAAVIGVLRRAADGCRAGSTEPAVLYSVAGGDEGPLAPAHPRPVDFWVFPLPTDGTAEGERLSNRACASLDEAQRVFFEWHREEEGIRKLRQRLNKVVQDALRRLHRKLEHRQADLRKAEGALRYKRYADLIMANLHALPATGRRDDHVLVTDWFADPDAQGRLPQVRVPIDPSLPLAENAARYYRQYSRYKRAEEQIARQLAETRDEIAYLEQVGASLEWCESRAELEEIAAELAAAGYDKTDEPTQTRARPRPSPAPSRPYRVVLPDGSEIRVGRNNRQNDELTMRWARPEDGWLHAKDIPGAHVVLRPPAGQSEPSEEAWQAAALLAAWFSRGRESSRVEVDCTHRRSVRKPKGAAPGMVIYDRERTLVVRPDRTAVERLLAGTQ